MSENDYIAEYIKEKYPRLLGVEFAFWKFRREVQTMAQYIIEVFKNMTPEEKEKILSQEAADEEEEEEAGEES